MTVPDTLRRYRLPLLGLAAVALVGALYAASPSAPPPADAPSAAPATPPSPAADNVDPGVHSRLMALRATAEVHPDSAGAHLALARFLHDAHRSAEAAEAYEDALAVDPKDRQVWLDLAQAYGALGQWDDVVKASDRMLEHFPGDPSAAYNAGAALANAGQRAEAKARWMPVAAQSADAAMARQASDALAQLDAMAAAGPATAAAFPPRAGSAPPLPPGAMASATLPAGHPTLPAGHPTVPAVAAGPTVGGVQAAVVSGGPAPADRSRLRTLITDLQSPR
ncbi:MAG TPA: tetratricopeptide repeat protein [Rubricoccaceae bacterium]|jgi:hypothetical protein